MATTIQTNFGDSTGATNYVTADITGGVQYPDVVAGYKRVDGRSYRTVYAAPIGQHRESCGAVRDVEVRVGIKSVTGEDGCKAIIEYGGGEFDGYGDSVVIAAGETELGTARKAVEWLKSNPAPEGGLFRPAVGDAGAPERLPVGRRELEERAECIRVGSVVEVDSLPPATVTDELCPDDLAVPSDREVFEAELPGGETIHLVVGDRIKYSDVLSYAGSVAEYEGRTIARHLSVSNESNLRASVDEELYEWLKARQGETAIRQTGETTFQVVAIDELRDGFLNPSDDGGLDPDSHRTYGRYIDSEETGQWVENLVDLPEGSYRVVERGVVEISDTYAGNVVVSAETWDGTMQFVSTEQYAVESIDAAPETVLTGDRDGLSRTDSVTDITGVGSATAEKFWHDDVSDLYHIGFPAVHIPGQYTEKAIADMYSLPSMRRPEDAARAVVGVLGGAAFNDAGERLGSVATMISDQLDPTNMAYGWLADDHKYRIKSEYTPSWLTSNASPDAVGAGAISVEDVRQSHDREVVEPAQATAIRQNLDNEDLAGVITDEGYVEVGQKPLKVMATVANVDLQAVGDDDSEHTISVLGNNGDGVIVLNNTTEPFTAVIDTDGKITPEQLRSDDSDE